MTANPRVHLATLQRDGYACQHGAGGVRCRAPASAVVSRAGGWASLCKAHHTAHVHAVADAMADEWSDTLTWLADR